MMYLGQFKAKVDGLSDQLGQDLREIPKLTVKEVRKWENELENQYITKFSKTVKCLILSVTKLDSEEDKDISNCKYRITRNINKEIVYESQFRSDAEDVYKSMIELDGEYMKFELIAVIETHQPPEMLNLN